MNEFYYKPIDQRLHQANQVMKHVTTLVNDANVPSNQSQDNCSKHTTIKSFFCLKKTIFS